MSRPHACVLLGQAHSLLLAFTLPACDSQRPPALRIGITPWPGYELLFLAQEQGSYREAGVEVRPVEFSSLADARRAFERSQLDVLASRSVEVLQARATSNRSPQIIQAVDSSEGTDLIVAQPGVANVQALRGKRVGVELASLGGPRAQASYLGPQPAVPPTRDGAMNAPLTRTRSLRSTLLVPMIGLGGLVACLGLLGVHVRIRADLEEALKRRAELVANTIIYSGEAASSSAALQRVVSALGADHDVIEIFVASGEPLTIRASTRGQWRDRPVSALPDREYSDDLKRAIALGEPSTHINEAASLFDYSAPIQLERFGATQGVVQQGAVMVHLDIRPMQASVRRLSLHIALTFGATLMLLLVLGVSRIQRHVLSPLSNIARHLSGPGPRSDETWPEEAREDEFGALARALRAAFLRSKTSLHELERQKFALDQHCIVTVTTPRGVITYANENFCAISQYAQ